MAVVTVSTDLPIPAERAFGLAQTPELFFYVVSPVLTIRGLSGVPENGGVGAGAVITGRIWWLGVIPSWKHTITVISAEPYEIRTEEGGGPVRVWNHRLRFESTGPSSCRYTDEVEIKAGPLTASVWLFVATIFRYRQARWRALTRVLAAAEPTGATTGTDPLVAQQRGRTL